MTSGAHSYSGLWTNHRVDDVKYRILAYKKMASFTMNASNIERFAALTTQMQKDLFEVNKNLMFLGFTAIGKETR